MWFSVCPSLGCTQIWEKSSRACLMSSGRVPQFWCPLAFLGFNSESFLTVLVPVSHQYIVLFFLIFILKLIYFPLFSNSLYKSGINPYPTPTFHYGPRHMGPSHTQPTGPAPTPAPMTHPVAESAQGPPRVPPPYGLISDLPLPVPTGDSQVH